MSNKTTSDVCMLREKTLWVDKKGRMLFIHRRAFEGFGPSLVCVEVEILVISPFELVTRPYKEVASYIETGKMKYFGDATQLSGDPEVQLKRFNQLSNQ
ncbi:hypothetical protein LZD49_12565 [Dyadobacter sp. CY261]|uniref:hypothetical protein n=1 Tax=Dyadobacter sp. CY261 TaxID=2907203 RepID=UPI001F365CB8|nr:hypothetical protein [Dyadobacter sp. CY261]MCF0071306.1 hypothetical protein [Dyadobacter sp. CY261]